MHTRTVRMLGVGYSRLVARPDGSVQVQDEFAHRGETITVSTQEAARLDALGALAAEGETAEDVAREVELKIEEYRNARRAVA